MHTLDLKVLRDVRHLKGQLLAVTVLVVCGVAVFIMLRSMYGHLRGSQADYYAAYRFGDVFAHAVRAPSAVTDHLAALPGVARVHTRIVRDVVLDVPGLAEPATGRMVSLPDHGDPPLNRLHITAGHRPQAGRRDQVVVSQAFARANALRTGDTFHAVLGGRRARLTVVGTALSPEFIYEVSGVGTVFPDNRRFGAMWMNRSALEVAFEMEGGFNDVVLDLVPGIGDAGLRQVLAGVDALLEPYGSGAAYGRDRHLSHEFVTSEIDETRITASFFPMLFLGVTAFLLHTTMVRLVGMEREQIGLLKAFGFTSSTVALHYVKLALVPVVAGGVAGTLLGVWLAGRMAGLYADFFQFPQSTFELEWSLVGTAWIIAVGTGGIGALAAARRVVRLAPAVAMAPPAPPTVRHGRLEALPGWSSLSAAGRNVVRNLSRTPWRSASTTAGIALSLGVLVALLSMFDAVDVIAELMFDHTYRDDVAVYFDTPRAPEAMHEVARLPGILRAEPVRIAPARVRFGHRERETALLGLPPGGELRRIVDADFRRHRPPPDGLLLGTLAATALGVEPGDSVDVEVTRGERPRVRVVVAGTVDEVMGAEAYLEAATLERILGEGPVVSGAWLRIDPLQRDALYAELKAMPGVASVIIKEVVVQGFEDTIEESFLIALTASLVLGAALVTAIVYNQTRIALSERARELASLRVLGFTRREVAHMLLGEQALLVLAALPPGLLLGWVLVLLVLARFETEMFRMPVVIHADTYLAASALVVVSALASALLVRRRLDRLDLIAVLKTRE
jgi:putative ABC transport system permease protein